MSDQVRPASGGALEADGAFTDPGNKCCAVLGSACLYARASSGLQVLGVRAGALKDAETRLVGGVRQCLHR